MAVNTTLQIVQYYVSLLIMQYLNKPNASGFINLLASVGVLPQTSVQTITFSAVPTSGNFVLTYDEENTVAISYNAPTSTIQSDLQALTGLSSIIVTGSIASKLLTVTFIGVNPPALALSVFSSTLFASSTVTITITETDLTLPLAIQNGFNLIAGTEIATGEQLDVIGKYVGASRSGLGFTGNIVLDDSDYYSLIQMAIVKNQAGSDMSTIVSFLWQFFPNQIFVYDNLNMTMTYIISQAIGSSNLIQMFVTQGLLPVPMAVGVNIFYPPDARLFSFAVIGMTFTAAGFNTVTSYDLDSHWLSAHDLIE